MRARQVVLLNLIILIVIVAAAVAGFWYFYNRQNYITVNDAHVDAKMTYVVTMSAGKLTNWTLPVGSSVRVGEVIGEEQLPTGQTVKIRAPASGQVLKNVGIAGETVVQGTMLGAIADVQNEDVVANVPETSIKDIKVGQTVDIYIDAYPGDSFSGTVLSVGNQSAAATTLLPSGASTGSFTKEIQRIPVDISISGKGGKYVIPQMNVTVRIHK